MKPSVTWRAGLPETMENGSPEHLSGSVTTLLGDAVLSGSHAGGQLTLDIDRGRIVEACRLLRDEAGFEQLTDLCGMDYDGYGLEGGTPWEGERFAVVYHLLSYARNERIRLRVQCPEDDLNVASVIGVWPGADWFEREAFDLFGIIFHGHPDLRRILTDYGFIGHPFRKDFPLSGQVEMRYDEEQERVIYQPVTIEPRILVPRSIRKDVFGPAAEENA